MNAGAVCPARAPAIARATVSTLFSSTEFIASLCSAAAIAGALGHRLAATRWGARERRLQHDLRRLEKGRQLHSQGAEELETRIRNTEKRCARFERSLVEIPDLAQRLAATRRLREIPEHALDLVQEVFQPRYSAFYRASRDALIAVAVRGGSELAVGQRVRIGEGVVGVSAQKQLALTAEDLARAPSEEGARLRAGLPAPGFALCLPITTGGRTLGAILVGPGAEAAPRSDEIGRTIALITSVVITSVELIREQRRLVETDGLTGLTSRTHLLARAKELLQADASQRSVGFFLFDVDHFKHYNDANGHLPGDELLQALSRLLRERTREEELVGRYGGEEFLVVMPGVERERALQAAERIRALIAATRFPHGEKQPGGCVSISGGISVWPIDGDDLSTLLKRADEALYAAKRAGRNRVHAYATAELGRGARPERVAEAVTRALFDDELENGSGPEA